MFCLTSIGGKVDTSVLDGRGPPCFKISGENYHRIGSLLPSPGCMNSFAQLYICDAENEVRNRLRVLRDVSNQSRNVQVSRREFWAFRFQHRESEGTTLLQGGHLFNQLVGDCYAAIEQQRLNYVKTHQAVIRGDLYQGLEGAVVTGDIDAGAIGKRIVLPSSFTGGPRNMMQHYQDSIAICRAIGPPDFFITFTCNPNWPEISRKLLNLPDQHTEDRPDIVPRIFRMKLKQLIEHFKEKKKRVLPHSHITLTLSDQDKPITPEDFDEFICAEIPNKDADPLAYATVVRSRCLLDEDNEWHEALSEALTRASSVKLRNKFSTMLMFSEITNPVNLWERHWRAMVDDLQHRIRRDLTNSNMHLTDEELKDLALQEIECTLNRNGKSLADLCPNHLPDLLAT
ncbi:hypothetical protein Sango_3108900 [Sesamum angolense]|uniref:Helitron helicase-like domain-containing protein n=1 Tax=Sesamum angolense TaxID=2727404 RepID=A0AAE1TA07_9LAMI|nr:hypothetical protein Sango_3108900 [Sesamum angolense]